MCAQYLLIIIGTFYVTHRLLHNWKINYSDGQETGKFCQLGEFQKKCWIDNEAVCVCRGLGFSSGHAGCSLVYQLLQAAWVIKTSS